MSARGPVPTLAEMVAEMQREFPRFRIVEKRDDRLSHVIDKALRILTFGGQREYLTHYHTVLGSTLYVPEGWDRIPDDRRVVTLRHELVHLRQSRRYGFPLFAFLYLVPFFPLGLAYGRARIEWEAYEETVRATAEILGREEAESPALRDRIVSQFTSAAYGWMWPFPRSVHRWYDEALAKIREDLTPPLPQTSGELRS